MKSFLALLGVCCLFVQLNTEDRTLAQYQIIAQCVNSRKCKSIDGALTVTENHCYLKLGSTTYCYKLLQRDEREGLLRVESHELRGIFKIDGYGITFFVSPKRRYKSFNVVYHIRKTIIYEYTN